MENISDDAVNEVARNLFDGGSIDYNIDRYGSAEIDTWNLPDVDNYEYSYGTVAKETLDKAIELLTKLISSVKFYVGDNGAHLELNDNRTLWNINAPDEYEGEFDNEYYQYLVDQALDEFEERTGVKAYQDGRMGRHIVVDITFDNMIRFNELKEVQESLEADVIKKAEEECFSMPEDMTESLNKGEKQARCLSCGADVIYTNRDVEHDIDGDYIECPNCHATFDVDYDNTASILKKEARTHKINRYIVKLKGNNNTTVVKANNKEEAIEKICKEKNCKAEDIIEIKEDNELDENKKTESRYTVYDYANGDTFQDEEEKGLEPSQFTIYDNEADDFYYDELGNNPVFDKEEDAKDYIKRNLTEAEDMSKVKDDVKNAVEKSDSTEQEKDQVKGSIDVLKTDEESAIKGYEEFNKETAKVVDKELSDTIDNQMQEIVDDEKEHIEKLDTIKSALGEACEYLGKCEADMLKENKLEEDSNNPIIVKFWETEEDRDQGLSEIYKTYSASEESIKQAIQDAKHIINLMGYASVNVYNKDTNETYYWSDGVNEEYANASGELVKTNDTLARTSDGGAFVLVYNDNEDDDDFEPCYEIKYFDKNHKSLEYYGSENVFNTAEEAIKYFKDILSDDNSKTRLEQSISSKVKADVRILDENKIEESDSHKFLSPTNKQYFDKGVINVQLSGYNNDMTEDELVANADKYIVEIRDLDKTDDGWNIELKGNLQNICNFVANNNVDVDEYINSNMPCAIMLLEECKITEATESGIIKENLNTGVLRIIDVDMYSLNDEIPERATQEGLDEIVQDIAPKYIKEVVQKVLPSVEIYATGVYHPRQYNFSGDELEFDLVANKEEYEALKEKVTSDENFNAYLRDNYKSYDGFISYMADDISEFETQDNWKQLVQVIMFALKDENDFESVRNEYLDEFLDRVHTEFGWDDEEDEELEEGKKVEDVTPEAQKVSFYTFRVAEEMYNSEHEDTWQDLDDDTKAEYYNEHFPTIFKLAKQRAENKEVNN